MPISRTGQNLPIAEKVGDISSSVGVGINFSTEIEDHTCQFTSSR